MQEDFENVDHLITGQEEYNSVQMESEIESQKKNYFLKHGNLPTKLYINIHGYTWIFKLTE